MLSWFKRTPVQTLSPLEVEKLVRDRAITLVDVREAGEWAQGHISGAIHCPLSQLESRLAALPQDKAIIFYCLSGARSASAVQVAQRAGLPHDTHMAGGITAWRMHGLPVTA